MRSESLSDMFLAPTGAQGVTPSVCLYGTKSTQKALSKHSECTQNTFRALSKLFCEAHVCILVYVKLFCESSFLTYKTDCWSRIKLPFLNSKETYTYKLCTHHFATGPELFCIKFIVYND